MRMRTSLIATITLMLAASAAPALTVDKSAIKFLGTSCKALTADDVTIADGRLVIDFSKRGGGSSLRGSCLIKIPYTDGDGQTTVMAAGTYQLGDADAATVSLRMDTNGVLPPAKILHLSHSPYGQFSQEDTLAVKAGDDVDKWVRLSVFTEVTTDGKAGENGRVGYPPSMQITQISLSNVNEAEGPRLK